MELRAVLFDLDGVLVETYHVWFRLLNAAAREFGYGPISPEDFRVGWGQGVEADVERFFANHSVAELAAYYEAHFDDHLQHLDVAPGVGPVFEMLRARGVGAAVVTNAPPALARVLVARAGASPDVLVGGTDVIHPKPAPDMILRACELLGTEPRRAVVVGDSRFDRDAARAAGAWFAGLRIDGDFRLETLEDLPGLLGAARPSRSLG